MLLEIDDLDRLLNGVVLDGMPGGDEAESADHETDEEDEEEEKE
jgi:hypothetical protein